MRPNLIYTFDESVLSSSSTIEFYNKSIYLAKKLGYTIELYTNSNLITESVDIIHSFSSGYILSDYTKHLPLSRSDEFVLIDGDVLLHSPIKFSNVDISIDTWESWSSMYNDGVKLVTDLGIKDVIPEWVYKPQKVMNTGILKINDYEFQQLYLNRWNLFYSFIKNSNIKDTFPLTAVGAQYLLTILVNHYSKSYETFSKYPRELNKYYQHFCGSEKNNNNRTITTRSII